MIHAGEDRKAGPNPLVETSHGGTNIGFENLHIPVLLLNMPCGVHVHAERVVIRSGELMCSSAELLQSWKKSARLNSKFNLFSIVGKKLRSFKIEVHCSNTVRKFEE